MKKLQAVLNTPAGVMTALVAITLAGEFLTLFLIESIDTAILKDVLLKNRLFEFIAPIALAAIVSIALYLLIFKPMIVRQAELERQLDELRNPLAAENTGTIQPATGSLEKQHLDTEQSDTQPSEESQLSALLFMLEDLKAERNKIEQAHQEWMAALDTVSDPIFMHDQQFRILRCNKAYQQCAGMPFHEIIGQPYYAVFPKSGAPLTSCLRAMEKAGGEEKEEVAVGNAIYCSSAFSIHDGQGTYLYSVHTLEDITGCKQAEANLAEQLQELRRWYDITLGRELRILELKHEVNELLGQAGQPPHYPSAESQNQTEA